MSLPSAYKPSPLSFGSPRTSPFRRPESPASPSNTIRPSTPTSPTKVHTPVQSPSKLQNANTPTSNDGSWTPRGLTPSALPRDAPASPTRVPLSMAPRTPSVVEGKALPSGDVLSKLPPAQVREMREAFQILDRDSDGQVNREDVIDVLANLGQDTSHASVSPHFPPSAPQTLSLPLFLNNLAALLAPLSSQTELMNAFAAFDDDDSGQIDFAELRDALLNTSPDVGVRALSERDVDQVLGGFVGRRAFGKGLGKVGRGDVFRYGEFVANVMGGSEAANGKESGKQ